MCTQFCNTLNINNDFFRLHTRFKFQEYCTRGSVYFGILMIISIFAALSRKRRGLIKQYETVFIATPVLSEEQIKEAVEKYRSFITSEGGEIVNDEDWGLKKLAYPIQKKTTGFYHLFEFRADSQFIEKLETQYRRDERIIRFLTFAMDKDSIAYSERRRANRKESATANTAKEE